MIMIDGSMGEGGGQIIRSSLALSAVTGKPFRIERIRASRPKPGLSNQHLSAVRAAAEACSAQQKGAEIRSQELEFVPGKCAPGNFSFDLGSAASTSLVFQTILPALMLAPSRSSVRLTGGTHNPFAPPFPFLDKVYLNLIQRMGVVVECDLKRYGFYPAGGGKTQFAIKPVSRLEPLRLLNRGELRLAKARAIVSNLPTTIAERQCRVIQNASGWDDDCFQIEQVASPGPGNAILIELQFDQVTELFTGFGSKGVRAEKVAQTTWKAVSRYLDSTVPVGEFLADQLLLPMALAAHTSGASSQFRTLNLSMHSETHIEVIGKFLKVEVVSEATSDDDVLVTVSPLSSGD